MTLPLRPILVPSLSSTSQVQALRSIEKYLGLEKLYVMGTNCVDNGRRETLDKFLGAASSRPAEALHYEFMQDYRVHVKHTDGEFEYIPYFCLPANELNDVIAPSCYSCFDYPNALADLVVGYMGVPYQNVDMTKHMQVGLQGGWGGGGGASPGGSVWPCLSSSLMRI